MNRWKVFGRLAVGKANPAEDKAKRLHQDAYSYSVYFSIPERSACDRLFSAGQKRVTAVR
jgi:hypothetical protein